MSLMALFGSLFLLMSALIDTSVDAASATLVFQCDNWMVIKRSDNGGSWTSWQKLGFRLDVSTPFVTTIHGVTTRTRIRVVCVDDGYLGGFIGQVTIGSTKYYTSNSVTKVSAPWKVYSRNVGTLKYTKKGTGNANWKSWESTRFDANAHWVWDTTTYNAIQFEFSFANIPSAALEAADEDTAAEASSDSVVIISVVAGLSLILCVIGVCVVMRMRSRREAEKMAMPVADEEMDGNGQDNEAFTGPTATTADA